MKTNISRKPFEQLDLIREELAKDGKDSIANQVVLSIAKSLIFERGFSLQNVDGIEVVLKHEVNDKYVHIDLSGKRIRVFDGAYEVLVYGSCNVLQPGKVHDLLVTEL